MAVFLFSVVRAGRSLPLLTESNHFYFNTLLTEGATAKMTDFIDWCHKVLKTLDDHRFSQHLGDYELQGLIFGEDSSNPNFHGSNIRLGMFQALEALEAAALAEKVGYAWKIVPAGRRALADPVDLWTGICSRELDEEEEKLLRIINKQSPQQEPNSAWLKSVGSEAILEAFEIIPPPPKSNEHMAELQKYLYGLPELLEQMGLLKTDARAGYHNDIQPTYDGLIWTDKREVTQRGIRMKSLSKFGIPDHRAFIATLESRNSSDDFVSLAFVDLDNFKSVNDNFDHSVGDQVIQETMSLIQKVVANKGEVYHRSGDEMLILLPNFDQSEAYAVAERVRQEIESFDFPAIGRGTVTATIGLATYPGSCDEIIGLEKKADQAAMKAKNRKNIVLASTGPE